MGMTPEEIVVNHLGLSLSAVFAALSHYHSHRGEIDADIEADEQFVAQIQAKAGESKFRQISCTSVTNDL